jgi:hypothetical protein
MEVDEQQSRSWSGVLQALGAVVVAVVGALATSWWWIGYQLAIEKTLNEEAGALLGLWGDVTLYASLLLVPISLGLAVRVWLRPQGPAVALLIGGFAVAMPALLQVLAVIAYRMSGFGG